MSRVSTGVLMVGLAMAIAALAALRAHYTEVNSCTMSWSHPVYYPIPFVSNSSKAGGKYSLYLYREGGVSAHYDHPDKLGGTPVLFLPGNAGSYSQGRSIAAEAANYVAEKGLDIEFDFFLVHFDEDMSAMHGKTLLDEAAYVNDAIAHILALYREAPQNFDDQKPTPESVIILSHSMGGIVARALVTLPTYNELSVNTIITLSTPHTVPPLTLDRDITAVYDLVNRYWRTHSDELSDIALISIAGGHGDLMVIPDYTSVESVIPNPENGLSVFSYAIPGVWRGIDHLAIVWCAELRDALVESLVAATDVSSPGRTLKIPERVNVFRNRLVSPLDSRPWALENVWWDPRASGNANTPAGRVEIREDLPGETVKTHKLESLWSLFFTGVTIPLDQRISDIELPLSTSLVAVNVKILGDEEGYFRHWTPHESRWYEGNSATLLWYSAGPFVPFNDSPRLHLQVLTEHPPIKVNVRIAWDATLANMTMRFRTLLLVYPLAVVCICFAIQLRLKQPTFKSSFDIFLRRVLPHLVGALTILHLLLAWPIVRDFVRLVQMPSESPNVAALEKVGFDVHDILVGTSDPFAAWAPGSLLVMATAFVRAVDLILGVVVSINKARPSVNILNRLSVNTVAWTGSILGCLVLFLVPYQVVLVAIALFQLFRTKDTRGAPYTFLHLLVWIAIIDAPIVVVWMRNMNWHWTLVFSTWHNLVSAAPIAILVALLKPLQTENGRFPLFTQIVLGYIAAYAILYGALHTFMLHHLVNYLAAWLLVAAL